MFRRPTVRYGTTPQPQTPHQRGIQEWDDRIGSARVQAKNWRLAFFGQLLMSGALTAGLIWLAERGTITPWVVEVNKLGEAHAVAPATRHYRPTDPEIAWYLAQFIKWVRFIPADLIVQHDDWVQAYKFVDQKGELALNDYAQHNDPFAKVGKEQVSVDIASVIRASDDSFRIEWVEHHFVDGALARDERWSAILTIEIQTPTDKDTLNANPLGIYVHAFNWSKELG
jgi:type IV secretion system protein TrbF